MSSLTPLADSKISAPAKPALLLVDDDNVIAESLSYALADDFAVQVASTRAQALAWLRDQPAAPPLALVDLGLPPFPHRPDEGFALIGDLLAQSPSIKIVVLSGQNELLHARRARALGAVEFVAKPCDPDEIKKHLFAALKIRGAELSAIAAATLPGEAGDFGIIGNSPAIQKMRRQIRQYANAPFPVLIEGESGSGKERVATSLHWLSERKNAPWYALNCAAIAPTLVEPTLFGYARGAFTGAMLAKSGYFEDACEGVLFLDEIGELPLELQAKLLRVLENGEYQRVGETGTRKSRARVIAATNRDLRQEMRAGNFRADLYHRLSVFTIAVPPLRDLGEDKLLLLAHFRDFYAAEGLGAPFELDAQATTRWQDYAFPGNVRELRNIVIRLATKYAGQTVGAAQLADEFDLGEALPNSPSWRAMDMESRRAWAETHLQQQREFDLDHTLKSWERLYIEAALKITGGNISQAAKLLGVNRATLYGRMGSEDRG